MEQPALRFVPCREDAHGSKDVCSTVTEIPSFLSRWTQADALINTIPDAALIASGSQKWTGNRALIQIFLEWNPQKSKDAFSFSKSGRGDHERRE